MAQWELPGDLVIKAGNQVFFESSGGPSWQAFADGGTNAMQFNYSQFSSIIGNAPTFSVRRYGGTAAAPLTLANNVVLGKFEFRGYDGSALVIAAHIQATTGAAWTTTEHHTRLTFNLYSAGASGVFTEAWRLSPDELRIRTTSVTTVFVFNIATTGGLQIGNASTQKLAFWGATPVVRDTGWGTPTGTFTKTTFDTTTVTLPQLAERVAALINTLKTDYGFLGA